VLRLLLSNPVPLTRRHRRRPAGAAPAESAAAGAGPATRRIWAKLSGRCASRCCRPRRGWPGAAAARPAGACATSPTRSATSLITGRCGGRCRPISRPRTLSWITRHRRTVRDYERLPAHHETYVYWAMIIVMTRRLARQPVIAQPTAT